MEAMITRRLQREKVVTKSFRLRLFSSSDGNHGTSFSQSDRDKQSKGAMKTYLFNVKDKNIDAISNTQGVFSRLRDVITNENRSNNASNSQPRVAQQNASVPNKATPSQPSWTPSNYVPSTNFPPPKPSGRIYKSTSSGSKGAGGSRVGGRGRGDRGRGRDERRSFDDKGDDIDPAIQSMLFDMDHFQDLVKAGKTISTEGMDDIDKFLAHALVESMKSSTDEFRHVETTPGFAKIQVPKPRSMLQLAHSITPRIHTAAPGTEGYRAAAQAWEVLSKNLHYSEADRAMMCNTIARIINKVIDDAGKDSIYKDMIFEPHFRKGLRGIEDEERRRKQQQPTATKTQQQATDWAVQAVVDEDQL